MKKKPILLLPFFILSGIAAISLIFYYFSNAKRNPIIFLQVPLAVLSAGIFPFLSKGKRNCFLSCFAVAVFVFLASILGSVFGFYHRFPIWDVLMHSLFGLVGSVILWEIYSPSPLPLFLSVMGASALWEIFEFISDILFGGDAQRVKAALSQNLNPISDTMTDLMITIVGIALFFFLIFLKKRGILLTKKA